jgi:hypothetical protein
LYPVADRRGISMNNPPRPVYKTGVELPDFPLDKARPQYAAAIDAQIDCNNASADFVKKKLHSQHALIPEKVEYGDGRADCAAYQLQF